MAAQNCAAPKAPAERREADLQELTTRKEEGPTMAHEEIKDIRENLRDILNGLDELDKLEEWDKVAAREARNLLSDFSHYADRQKSYYKQYKGILRD